MLDFLEGVRDGTDRGVRHLYRAVARYLWAMLLARIYEALPLSCPIRHAAMRIVAFINDAGSVKKILDQISANPPGHPASPQRAGHRCGRRQRRNRPVTILRGIGQPGAHRR